MTRLADFYLDQGSFGQTIRKTAEDPETGLPIDIAWATTARFEMWRPSRPDLLVVQGTASLTGPTGAWQYTFVSGDTLQSGLFVAALHCTSVTRDEQFPNPDWLAIMIRSR